MAASFRRSLLFVINWKLSVRFCARSSHRNECQAWNRHAASVQWCKCWHWDQIFILPLWRYRKHNIYASWLCTCLSSTSLLNSNNWPLVLTRRSCGSVCGSPKWWNFHLSWPEFAPVKCAHQFGSIYWLLHGKTFYLARFLPRREWRLEFQGSHLAVPCESTAFRCASHNRQPVHFQSLLAAGDNSVPTLHPGAPLWVPLHLCHLTNQWKSSAHFCNNRKLWHWSVPDSIPVKFSLRRPLRLRMGRWWRCKHTQNKP